jgi:hypothetical protein
MHYFSKTTETFDTFPNDINLDTCRDNLKKAPLKTTVIREEFTKKIREGVRNGQKTITLQFDKYTKQLDQIYIIKELVERFGKVKVQYARADTKRLGSFESDSDTLFETKYYNGNNTIYLKNIKTYINILHIQIELY